MLNNNLRIGTTIIYSERVSNLNLLAILTINSIKSKSNALQ